MSYIEPSIGMRFSLCGSQFEVSFVANAMVRYSANAGGRQYRIPYIEFVELQKQGKISVADCAVRVVTESVAPTVVRKHRYVESALRQLKHPTAVEPLKAVINQVAASLGDTSPPAVSSVAKWIRRYQQSGPNGLIGSANSGNRTIRLGVEVERIVAEAIKLVYLQREKHSARDVRDHVVGRLSDLGLCGAREDIHVPTLRTIQRRLKQLDPYVVTRAQRGEEAAHRLLRAAGRSIKAHAILSIVEADTHTLDVMIVDPDTKEVLGRPFLTCMIDVHTRAIVGTYVSLFPPSAVTSLAAFKDMLTRYGRGLPGGVPAQLCPDNGIEFKNSAFSRLCQALSVTLTPSQVREPNGKPHIERFFGTITNDLIQKLSGTTFSNPAQRGDYESEKRARFTLAEVRSFIDEWIERHYHRSVHARTGRAPICAWEEQVAILPPLTLAEIDVNALARRPVQRSIVHGRVRCAGLEYFSPALATIEAQGNDRVIVLIDDLDLNSVLIQHPSHKDTLIHADSVDPGYTVGLTSYEHAETMRIKKGMSARDRAILGHHANSIARWELLQRIHSCNRASKLQIRKITAGLGRKTHIEKLQTQLSVPSDSWAGENRESYASVGSPSTPDVEAVSSPLPPALKPEVRYESFDLD